MKKLLRYTFITIFLVFTSFISLNAQPHAGQQSGGGGVNGDRIGDAPSGAPVGSGTILLLSLVVLYGSKKAYSNWKSLDE